MKNKELNHENCCTPLDQIKRYVNCKGCDRKPKQLKDVEIESNTTKTKLEEAAAYYAHNWFDMHETNNYKALKQGFEAGAKWQQEQILNFLYFEIIQRRDYSASKMCEEVVNFIKGLDNEKNR